jgi:hypothetical protein
MDGDTITAAVGDDGADRIHYHDRTDGDDDPYFHRWQHAHAGNTYAHTHPGRFGPRLERVPTPNSLFYRYAYVAPLSDPERHPGTAPHTLSDSDRPADGDETR